MINTLRLLHLRMLLAAYACITSVNRGFSGHESCTIFFFQLSSAWTKQKKTLNNSQNKIEQGSNSVRVHDSRQESPLKFQQTRARV